MRARAIWLPLAVGLAAGAEPEPVFAPIVIYTGYQHQPPSPISDAIRGEVEGILGRAGIEFNWRSLVGREPRQQSADLAVVQLKGRCDIAGILPHQVQPGALGWTYVSEGSVLPFGDVDCDRVRAFVQAGLLGVPARLREQAFGRAVGRVLAHELYHILTRSLHHGAKGVGKAEYSVRDLLGDSFVFDDAECAELRANQSRLLSP